MISCHLVVVAINLQYKFKKHPKITKNKNDEKNINHLFYS